MTAGVFSRSGRCVQFWGRCVQSWGRCVQSWGRCVQFLAECVQFRGECVHFGGRCVQFSAGRLGWGWGCGGSGCCCRTGWRGVRRFLRRSGEWGGGDGGGGAGAGVDAGVWELAVARGAGALAGLGAADGRGQSGDEGVVVLAVRPVWGGEADRSVAVDSVADYVVSWGCSGGSYCVPLRGRERPGSADWNAQAGDRLRWSCLGIIIDRIVRAAQESFSGRD